SGAHAPAQRLDLRTGKCGVRQVVCRNHPPIGGNIGGGGAVTAGQGIAQAGKNLGRQGRSTDQKDAAGRLCDGSENRDFHWGCLVKKSKPSECRLADPPVPAAFRVWAIVPTCTISRAKNLCGRPTRQFVWLRYCPPPESDHSPLC